MKYLIIVTDGMADWPIKELGSKTPLQAARTPSLDALCRKAVCGHLLTIPEGMDPGSEIANLSILGYDPVDVYQGRGILEAASMGIPLLATDLVLRCNLICIDREKKIKNHSAGHISSTEALELVKALNQALGKGRTRIYPGVSYRHVLILENGKNKIRCTPPHDIPGTDFRKVMIKALGREGEKTAKILTRWIIKSQQVLQDHPVNLQRIAGGKDPANSIWPWSPGHKPEMFTYQEKFGLSGVVISAVDLIRGIGIYAGFDILQVEGATGLYDTNYEGKTETAIQALDKYDLVLLHIEAPDEAGHEGDPWLKIKTIEDIDSRVIKPLNEYLKHRNDVSVAILPDHATPCEIKTHTNDPVPFMIYYPGEQPDAVTEFNEESAWKGRYGLIEGDDFIHIFLQQPGGNI